MEVIIKPFNKPTHWTDNKAWINLNVEFVKKAKKEKKYIVIKLPEGYCKPVDPNELLRNGVKTEAVFKGFETPMKLVGGYYELFSPEVQERIENDPYFWTYFN